MRRMNGVSIRRVIAAMALALACGSYAGTAQASSAERSARTRPIELDIHQAEAGDSLTPQSQLQRKQHVASEPLSAGAGAAVQVGGWLLWAGVLLAALLRRRI